MNAKPATTNPVLNNVIDFDQGDDVQFVKNVWSWAEANRISEGNISDRVYKMMLKFNDPKSPASAAAAAKSHLVDVLRKAKLEIKEIDSTIYGLKANKDGGFDITGNGAFANAFKVFYNCMELGGDLNQYVTMSSAKKFVQTTNEAKRIADRKNSLYNEQSLKYEHELKVEGKEVNTEDPEFKREVTKRVSALIVTGGDETKDSREEGIIHDRWFLKGLEIADAARNFAERTGNEAQAEQMVDALLDRIGDAVQAFLAAQAKQAASNSAANA